MILWYVGVICLCVMIRLRPAYIPGKLESIVQVQWHLLAGALLGELACRSTNVRDAQVAMVMVGEIYTYRGSHVSTVALSIDASGSYSNGLKVTYYLAATARAKVYVLTFYTGKMHTQLSLENFWLVVNYSARQKSSAGDGGNFGTCWRECRKRRNVK